MFDCAWLVSVRPTQTRALSVLCAVCASKTIQYLFFRVMLTHVKYMNIPTGMTHSEGTASQKEERRGVGETLYNGSRYWDQHIFWVSVF